VGDHAVLPAVLRGGLARGERLLTQLFAGIRVSDFEAAKGWYVRLLGSEPSFMPHDTEAVWELDERQYVYILEDAEGAGHALIAIFVDDLDATVAATASRGIEPTEQESYPGGASKAIYHDADGNEVSFGGGI
jgi:catechol 2,3-dioxygenase-like lactoylglutathione lyase family enzyme